jgi:hypothetical protein
MPGKRVPEGETQICTGLHPPFSEKFTQNSPPKGRRIYDFELKWVKIGY